MNRNEAYESMAKGEKIRHKHWRDGAYALCKDGKFFYVIGKIEFSVAGCMSPEYGYELYQEPEPVRTLRAFEHGNGTIVLRYCDKTNDLEFSSNYRKLSDEELKELIKGVICE